MSYEYYEDCENCHEGELVETEDCEDCYECDCCGEVKSCEYCCDYGHGEDEEEFVEPHGYPGYASTPPRFRW